ncbi:DegT/DnrJ/EryC1/StrS family aminotransferase [Acanthopleuribacter pedis]|uniref:DegT/DnrJ/EryC1/StrS family aminotransferase n=1 Tax=Acanthopleuribacter pedis TaxID=442870 RepID=A0A8J7QE68_9BACT|nr:DegT/DnrJ/EryC1/StrS family aminotransferase [Acanthopleuribacter pedis]MBO1318005.1 DegT/DnrJ/EryC1/StrS family aminotransferase [Acanthopleuribacter pedis]
MIHWWNIDLGETAVDAVTHAIRNRKISQGTVSQAFEEAMAAQLGVPHVVVTTSGTNALMLAFLACGVGPGDEVILPDRTYIATAHAAMLLGAKVRLVDVRADRPLMDPANLKQVLTPKTKVVVPVHLNGRAVDMDAVNAFAAEHGLMVVEDAAQALMSRDGAGRFLGTQSRFGCFSLGMAKLLTTGQGGLVVVHERADYERLQKMKNQGVYNPSVDKAYEMLAGNFKFTDIQAAIGLSQMERLEKRMVNQRRIYETYRDGLAGVACLEQVAVNVDQGELPLRAEFLCRDREGFLARLLEHEIQAIPQIPSLHLSPHLHAVGDFPNSMVYSDHLLTLPCGPDQPIERVEKVVAKLQTICTDLPSWS